MELASSSDFTWSGVRVTSSAGHVVLELREFAGADDGDDGDGAVAQPRERDLRHAFADLIGDGFQRL